MTFFVKLFLASFNVLFTGVCSWRGEINQVPNKSSEPKSNFLTIYKMDKVDSITRFEAPKSALPENH